MMRILVIGLCLLTAACGDDDDGAEEIAFEDLPGEVSEVLCSQVDPCFGPLADFFIAGSDCNTTFSAQFEDGAFAQIEVAIGAGTVVYHADKVRACLDAFAALGCDVFGGRPPEECEEAVEGTIALGEDCEIDAECVGAAFCQVEAACPGTCTEYGGSGDGCDRDDECEAALVCANDACTAPAGDGEACGGATAPGCEGGLFCVGEDGQEGSPGTCQAIDQAFSAAEGESCSPLEGPFCVEGISCVVDGVEGQRPIFVCVGPSEAGGACKGGVPDPCPDDQACDANPFAGDFEGVCQPLPGAGETCAEGLPGASGCLPGLVCAADTCAEVHRIGGSCEDDSACYSENCESGLCAAPPQCELDTGDPAV